MAAKQLAFDEDARKALLRGVEKLSRAVKVTLPRAATWCSTSPSARRASPRTA